MRMEMENESEKKRNESSSGLIQLSTYHDDSDYY